MMTADLMRLRSASNVVIPETPLNVMVRIVSHNLAPQAPTSLSVVSLIRLCRRASKSWM
jgi:hypothetical protein